MPFDPTVTEESIRAANAAAEAAAANPEAFEALKPSTTSSMFSWLDVPIDYIKSIYFSISQTLGHVLYYLKTNAWSIVFMLVGGYMVKTYVIDPWWDEFQARRSYRQATNPKRTKLLDVDLHRVRAAQQEEAQRKSAEAAEEAKKKKAEELEQKRVKQPMEVQGGGGTRLGGESKPRRRRPDSGRGSSDPSRSGYNPMNPWSSDNGSGGYRAPRRDVNRRGG